MTTIKRGDRLRALVVLLVYQEYYEAHGEVPRQADMYLSAGSEAESLFDLKWRALGLHREYPFGVPSPAALYRVLPLLRAKGLVVDPQDGVSVKGGRPRVGVLTDKGRALVERLRRIENPYDWPEVDEWT